MTYWHQLSIPGIHVNLDNYFQQRILSQCALDNNQINIINIIYLKIWDYILCQPRKKLGNRMLHMYMPFLPLTYIIHLIYNMVVGLDQPFSCTSSIRAVILHWLDNVLLCAFTDQGITFLEPYSWKAAVQNHNNIADDFTEQTNKNN